MTKRNETGYIDVAAIERRAQKMRSEAFAAGFAAFVAWVRRTATLQSGRGNPA